MIPEPRPWKKSILTGDVLCAAWWPSPPFTWNNSTSLALNLFILIWTTPHGLNVTSAIPPFIYSVGPGNQFMLLDPDVFFAPSSVVDSSNLSCPLYSNLFPCRLFQSFKMARRKRCPDGDEGNSKKKKKDEKPPTKRHDEGERGKSTHAGDNIGNFKAVQMAECIAEINYWESKAKAEGTPLAKQNSRNNICDRHGISPSSLSKRMTGKVLGLGPQLGGVRRGRVLTAGR